MSDVNDVSRVFVDPEVEKRVASAGTFEELADCKQLLESEVARLLESLRELHCDMDTPLVVDGYPRSDVDVYQVRHIRRLVHMCRNDLATVMDRLHAALATQFNGAGRETSTSGVTTGNTSSATTVAVPFATIVEVVAGGPVALAGAEVGDKVCSVGPVNVTNHNQLRALANHVQGLENTQVPLVVQRNSTVLHLNLTPTRNWNGQGLLGCRFQQI